MWRRPQPRLPSSVYVRATAPYLLPDSLVTLSLAELVQLLPPPAPTAPALPTGIATLDAVLQGGGLPRGRLTEIVGAPGSGKTTIARAVVEATIADHGWVAYVDAQRTLDPRDWVHLGDAEGVWMIRPHDAARAAWCADVLLRSGAFALVVLDGAPTLTKSAAVRLTRLARDGSAAFVILGDRTGGASQLGGAVRLVVERSTPGSRRSGRPERDRPERSERPARGGHERSRREGPPAGDGRRSPAGGTETTEQRTRTIAVRVEKGGTLRTVEVSCAVAVARRLCAHPEVPDRRGVARGPAGGARHARSGRAASPPPFTAGSLAPVEPPRELRTAVERARALG